MNRCSRSNPYDIYLYPEAQLAHLYKTTSCEVDVAARRSEIDVIRVAAGALTDNLTRPAAKPHKGYVEEDNHLTRRGTLQLKCLSTFHLLHQALTSIAKLSAEATSELLRNEPGWAHRPAQQRTGRANTRWLAKFECVIVDTSSQVAGT